MALIEKTQFSIAEFTSFLKAGNPPANKREEAMNTFGATQANILNLETLGGLDNIARVRVLERNGVVEYDLVTKLPPAMVAERRAAKAREEKRAAILVEMEKLRSDPKALEKFIQDVVFSVLGRGYALGLLKGLKPAPKAKSKPAPARKPPPKASNTYSAPKKAIDDYSKALEQDRRNRIEAAKKAAVTARKAS